jgi:hypothetical protein
MAVPARLVALALVATLLASAGVTLLMIAGR